MSHDVGFDTLVEAKLHFLETLIRVVEQERKYDSPLRKCPNNKTFCVIKTQNAYHEFCSRCGSKLEDIKTIDPSHLEERFNQLFKDDNQSGVSETWEVLEYYGWHIFGEPSKGKIAFITDFGSYFEGGLDGVDTLDQLRESVRTGSDAWSSVEEL